jgi:hypothetical protein
VLPCDLWHVRFGRALCGSLGLTAVGTQLVHSAALPGFSWWNFFGYFTILSNIAAAAMLVFGALRPYLRDSVRGMATVCMATTGLVFALLLHSANVGLTLPWADTVMHRIMPVMLALEWLLVRPIGRLNYAKVLLWVGFPAVYLVYTIARGAIVGWYPYPFLRPEQVGGVVGEVTYLAGIGVGMVAMSLLAAWLGNMRSGGTKVAGAAVPSP